MDIALEHRAPVPRETYIKAANMGSECSAGEGAKKKITSRGACAIRVPFECTLEWHSSVDLFCAILDYAFGVSPVTLLTGAKREEQVGDCTTHVNIVDRSLAEQAQ